MGFIANQITELRAKVHTLLYESMLLNWDAVNKSILVLILAGIDQILWFSWSLHGYLNPQVSHWFNLNYLYGHIVVLSLTLVSFFVFAKLIHKFQHIEIVRKYAPYFAILYFGLVFLHGGYSVGIMSPATIAAYVSLATVGLVLFDRKIIYLTLVPITIILLVAILFTTHGYLDYAPTFSDQLNQSILIENKFWVYSMLYHYIPIFLASIVLFEVLLIQWRHREKTFDTMSKIDPLTGIFNRRIISENLKTLQKNRSDYSIVILDLDHFKSINDDYGHDIGDKVLQHVAKILSENVRDGDIVGRFGGEEFILILKEKQLSYALEIAERCRQKISEEPIYLSQEMKNILISASFGVSIAQYGLSEEAVLKQADQALYHAKKRGRNQVCEYSLL